MSKAEERAKERYWLEPNNIETQEKYSAYVEGYQQAEKDLELTWNDVALILNIAEEFNRKNTVPISDEEYFKEVLKRFKTI
jgi:hypothetical protein